MKTALIFSLSLVLYPALLFAQKEPINYDWTGSLEINCAQGEHSAHVLLPTPAPSRTRIWMVVSGWHGIPETDDGDDEFIAGHVWCVPGQGRCPEIIIRESAVRGGQDDTQQDTWKDINLTVNPEHTLSHGNWQQCGQDHLFFNGGDSHVHAWKEPEGTPE